MHLANYGMIGLNGSVRRPEPGANFKDYQNELASYRRSLSLRDNYSRNTSSLEERMQDLARSIHKTMAENRTQ